MGPTIRYTDDDQPAAKGEVRQLEVRVVKLEADLANLNEQFRALRQTLLQVMVVGFSVFGGMLTAIISIHFS